MFNGVYELLSEVGVRDALFACKSAVGTRCARPTYFLTHTNSRNGIFGEAESIGISCDLNDLTKAAGFPKYALRIDVRHKGEDRKRRRVGKESRNSVRRKQQTDT